MKYKGGTCVHVGTQLSEREEWVLITFMEHLVNCRQFVDAAQFLTSLQHERYNPDFTEEDNCISLNASGR